MSFRLGVVGGRAVLVADGGEVVPVESIAGATVPADPMALLADPAALHELHRALDPAAAIGTVDDVAFEAPVPRPAQVLAIGMNYGGHVAEMGRDASPAPVVFTKFPSCIVGPDADVVLGGDRVDFEAELVLVVGRGGRDIPADEAWDHVAGVTCGQDLSDRALQMAARPPHFALAKSRAGYGPIGPLVVSVDLLADPDDLAIGCTVDGEVRQSARTSQMLRGVPELVEYLSAIVALGPGDLVFTGTPEGVGMGDGRFLVPGAEIVTTIEGVGTLRTTCA